MSDYLEELFRLHLPDYDADPQYQDVTSALQQCENQIETALGQTFLGQFQALEFHRYDIESLAAFRHGFHLAVTLMVSHAP